MSSAASSSNPPANTEQRAHNSRSAALQSPQLHSIEARSVCCRAGRARPPRVNSPSRSPSRSSICSADSTGSRAAASSMASGMPSSRRQILATAAAFASVTANPGTTCAARSANKLTAGNRASSATLSGRPACGAGSGGTASTVSPSMVSASRLVASTRSPPAARSSWSASSAAASTRCSQLSSTSSSCRPARYSASAVAGAYPARSCSPSVPATAWATSAWSRSWSSWTSHTPSRNARASPAAARSASRVLPTPPAPVSVTSRESASSRLTSASSPRRPTKLVTSAGRFPGARVTHVMTPACASHSDLGPVGCGLRVVPDVARLPHSPPPARELQQDSVRVLEVEGPDEHARVQFPRHAELAVVVVEDRADPHALGLEFRPVLQEALFGHVESDVVHRADGAGPLADARYASRRRDARDRVRRVPEPEERQRVPATHVEEEVLAHTARQVDRLDQPHAEYLGVELRRPLHVRADQREVIHTADIELAVPPLHLGLLRAWRRPSTKSRLLAVLSNPGSRGAASDDDRQGVCWADVTCGRPGRRWRASLPGHLPPSGAEPAIDRVHRNALQRRLLRALPGRPDGRARLRLPGLEHAFPRERGTLSARSRAGRDRRGGALVARAGGCRTDRAARQLRRRFTGGRLPVAIRRAAHPASCGHAPAARCREAATWGLLRGACCPLGPTRGADELARPVGDGRGRSPGGRP